MNECDYCSRQGDDVRYCIDPYNQDVNNDEVWMYLCPDCYQQRIDDI